MGNSLAHRGRLAPAIILALVIVAVAVAALVAASSAQALPTFNQAVNGIGPCDSCHTEGTVHSPDNPVMAGTNANHTGIGCATCHTSGTSNPPSTAACGGCHGGVTAILATTSHTSQGCGTTVGCHGFTAPPVTTVMTGKVAPTSVKTGKSVTISGSVTPAAQLGGAKVSILVNRKSGSKWVKAKSGSATAKSTGAYSWKYKATKSGSYQVKISVKASSTYTAASVTKTFKVKSK